MSYPAVHHCRYATIMEFEAYAPVLVEGKNAKTVSSAKETFAAFNIKEVVVVDSVRWLKRRPFRTFAESSYNISPIENRLNLMKPRIVKSSILSPDLL